ncbi:5-carboxymethyl-2-hydroxymuconate Delta-isomerase [Photobacterium carnosum]|uniref:5-carboxymethyl-2-hydroxymuconate Delta-isomerase n=1 Tax=Photobacterium carnosum TaxID=2023717 RepID=UPI00128B5402|nr:5-carboxymethyl-2-hydroxymuconate Delta-isomerase [Photobacterium carnosum]KAE8178248.1 5-carboxymethyl-2-hydroxymuconate isomerase [Photobacterium carnosum]MCD9526835.1 5-carboxymethyl-2-hydroxymuconate isomerase [Photobacterium carnosum]
MPHCIVEYAKDLETDIDLTELMTTTHFSIFSSGIFEEEDIKTRLIPYEVYRTGTTEKPFVHITLRILPGRSDQQKDTLLELILHNVASMFHSDIALSVEIEDINQQSYRKYVV